MRIISCQSTLEAVETVASIVAERISAHPSAVIGLATGKTMTPVYAALAGLKPKVAKNFFFMLDEYVGIDPQHPSSFHSYISQHVLKPLNLRLDQIAFPPAHHADLVEAAFHYEKNLKEAGGIDLQLLGIGKNGHIGFNEPGSLGSSRTRRVLLTEETREANQASFHGEMPKEALTMGIGTILEAKELVMLATGKSKADAIKYLLNHHEDLSCPATFLKSHPHFTLVLDPDAASKINLNI
jgi:glucosamine-6-phosphate deaminase